MNTRTFPKLLALLLTLVLSLSLLAACNTAESGGETSRPAGESTADSDPAGSDPSRPEETDPPAATELKIVEGGTSQYRVIISDRNSDFLADPAYALIDAIAARTGATLSIATDFEHPSMPENTATDYEILIGTTRDGKYFTLDVPELASRDFYITVVGTRIVILGGSNAGILRGLDHFTKELLPAEETDAWTLPVTTDLLIRDDNAGILTVMSQNLLNNNTEHKGKVILGTDIPVDQAGKNSIANRQPRIRSLFLGIMPDVIGLQECGNWHSFLEGDSALLGAGYKLVTCQKDRKISILYNTNTLTALESGSIYLTEDPENLACSKEWNSNGNPRLAHFVRFRQNDTDKTFIVVNCHIGFENQTLQYNQTRVVAEYCAQLHERFGDPVVCVGDFNSQKSSPHYAGFVDTFAGGFMADTKFEAGESSVGKGSFHALGARDLDPNAIDQVMVSEGDWEVYTYRVDNTVSGEGDLFYSDHFGVIATMRIRE